MKNRRNYDGRTLLHKKECSAKVRQLIEFFSYFAAVTTFSCHMVPMLLQVLDQASWSLMNRAFLYSSFGSIFAFTSSGSFTSLRIGFA